MALTNLVLGAAVLAAAALLFATDIRKSGAMFRRNARKIWAWLDEEMKSASAVSRRSRSTWVSYMLSMEIHNGPPKSKSGPTPPTRRPEIQIVPSPPTSKLIGPPPPPPVQNGASKKEKLGMTKPVIIVGAFLSILLYASPFVVYWSSGSNYDVIRSFYTKFDLLSIALSIISWLMFSLCQRHGVDGKTVGWAPIIVYSIGLVLYCVLLVMRFCPDGTICHTTIALLLGITLLLLLFDMFEPIKREQKTAKVLSGLAALMQLTSEALPYAGMRALCCADPAPAPVIVDLPQASSQAPVVVDPPQAPAQAPVIKNRRKLTIFVRAVDAGVTLFWAVYCAYNYDHSFFWFANVTSAVLSWGSAYVYISWALRPVAGHQAQEGDAEQ
uniref:Uncharacterized protein n=2 Tax=Oryza TaxID=4527 RepID=A0A0E0FQE6_ORYNI